MPSQPSRWQELLTESRFTCPKLFYNFSSDDQGYKLLFTDLVGLWSEVLEPEEIYQYAKSTHTSIDPSQSKTQFKVLLQKLEQSLENGTNSLFHDPNSAGKSLTISTMIDLPKPLQALRWQFRLKPEDSSEMAENILRPSLHEASESKKKLDSLFEVIRQKDHVIAKLLERIDNSSLDLSLIFPRITGLKSRKGVVTSKDAQSQVPGLGPFNRSGWNNIFSTDSTYADFHTLGLSSLMAGCVKCPKHTMEKHEQWLHSLPTHPPDVETQVDQTGSKQNEGANTSSDSDSESDHFESRPQKRSLDSDSPTKLVEDQPAKRTKLSRSQSASSQRISQDSDASTISHDSEDLDLPSIPAGGSKKKTRLGQLGSKPTNQSFRPSPNGDGLMPPPPTSSSPVRPKGNSLSSSPLPLAPLYNPIKRLDSIDHPSSPIASSSLNPSTPRKLGRLKSQKTASDPATPESCNKHHGKSDTSRETSLPMTPTRRLGRIGASRGPSQAQSQPQSQFQRQDALAPLGDNLEDADAHSDSDASTASTSSGGSTAKGSAVKSLMPQLLPQESSTEFHTQNLQTDTMTAKGKAEENKTQEMTKEEKAKFRRQELKRKVGLAESSVAEGGTGGPAASRAVATGVGGNGVQPPTRKKRKF